MCRCLKEGTFTICFKAFIKCSPSKQVMFCALVCLQLDEFHNLFLSLMYPVNPSALD